MGNPMPESTLPYARVYFIPQAGTLDLVGAKYEGWQNEPWISLNKYFFSMPCTDAIFILLQLKRHFFHHLLQPSCEKIKTTEKLVEEY
jgi:hypothetical protein